MVGNKLDLADERQARLCSRLERLHSSCLFKLRAAEC